MGLDSVELVMDVEDRFKIALPDTECERVRTVADLAALVLSKLPRMAEGVCPTARTFYEIRGLFVRHGVAPRRAVRPGALLNDLMPDERVRRRTWDAMWRENRALPRLTRSPAWDRAMLCGSGALFLVIVVFIGTAFATVLRWGFWPVFPAVSATAIIGTALYTRLYRSYHTQFPAGITTVGDLARVVAPLEVSMSNAGQRLIAQHRVLEEIRRITADQTGLPLEKVKPESDFIKDLGMG